MRWQACWVGGLIDYLDFQTWISYGKQTERMYKILMFVLCTSLKSVIYLIYLYS